MHPILIHSLILSLQLLDLQILLVKLTSRVKPYWKQRRDIGFKIIYNVWVI